MCRLTIIFLILISLNCNSQNNLFPIDRSDYTIINHIPSDSVFVNMKSAELSYDEMVDVEKLLKTEFGGKLKKGKYFRQYIAAENQKKQKIVWINFLCKKFYEPKWQIKIATLGKENCNFEVKVNLNEKNLFDYRGK